MRAVIIATLATALVLLLAASASSAGYSYLSHVNPGPVAYSTYYAPAGTAYAYPARPVAVYPTVVQRPVVVQQPVVVQRPVVVQQPVVVQRPVVTVPAPVVYTRPVYTAPSVFVPATTTPTVVRSYYP